MPILLKKIEAEIISLFGDITNGDSSDFTGSVYLVTDKLTPKVIGEAGIEDYIELKTFIALTQDFSNVADGSFCISTESEHGLGQCNTYEDLILDKK